jgi:hypothetical protein
MPLIEFELTSSFSLKIWDLRCLILCSALLEAYQKKTAYKKSGSKETPLSKKGSPLFSNCPYFRSDPPLFLIRLYFQYGLSDGRS